MAALPTLQSLPEETVNVVYDGQLGDAKYWIFNIEPSGALRGYRPSSAGYEIIDENVLRLSVSPTGYSQVSAFFNAVVDSIQIEGVYRATNPAIGGSVGSLSEVTYKVVPVSE